MRRWKRIAVAGGFSAVQEGVTPPTTHNSLTCGDPELVDLAVRALNFGAPELGYLDPFGFSARAGVRPDERIVSLAAAGSALYALTSDGRVFCCDHPLASMGWRPVAAPPLRRAS